MYIYSRRQIVRLYNLISCPNTATEKNLTDFPPRPKIIKLLLDGSLEITTIENWKPQHIGMEDANRSFLCEFICHKGTSLFIVAVLGPCKVLCTTRILL